ncbi:MAG: hypothetical protein GQ534_07710, partial [Candidatus Delongbacteria bacterium]|nr:hypothetical protein [Candidatus Delongbacteria bacterium]
MAQFAGGTGTEEDPWLIRTAENLDSIRYFLGAEHADKHFYQVYLIPLWNYGDSLWTPIGTDSLPFMGNYEVEMYGSDYKYDYYWNISYTTINDPLSDNLGIFGVIQNATIKNVQIQDIDIIGKGSCGGLAGKSTNSVITNCSVSYCKISGTDNDIGGLIGTSVDDSISVCCVSQYHSSDDRISGVNNIGGFIG